MNSVVVKNQVKLNQWALLINESVNSGMKIKDWLKEKEITKDTYYYWKRKVSDHALDAVSASFVEIPVDVEHAPSANAVTINAEKVAASSAEIRIGNTTISVFESASCEFIKKLIGAVTDVK